MGLIAQDNLTVVDRDFESKRRQTSPGMAHFSGTGPAGKTCRECAAWTGCGKEDGYFARKGRHGGIIKPRPCAQYRALMQGDVGPGVPHDSRACKYFSESKSVPPVVAKY